MCHLLVIGDESSWLITIRRLLIVQAVLRSSGMFCSTWAGWLQLWRFAHCVTFWTIYFAYDIVTIRTYTTTFYLCYLVYWYWSHSDSRLIFLLASGPICLVESWWLLLTHAQLTMVTQKLRLTVHCCALWPIVAVTLLFLWRLLLVLLIVLLQYISQACWVLCSPRLDFFHRTAIVHW